MSHTPRAKKVIEFAIEEARALNHTYVGTEHLLLGILRETEGVAAQVLMKLGLRLEDVRQEILNLLGSVEESDDTNQLEDVSDKDSQKEGTSLQVIEPLTILIDPGQASSEDIGELFFRLSKLYKMMGGSGLEFRTLDVREGVPTNV